MSPSGIPDDLKAAYTNLQQEYLREAPARLAELRKDLAAWLAREPDATDSLRKRFHQLAGSGGSFGFPEVTRISREMEQLLLAADPASLPAPARIEQAIQELALAFDSELVQEQDPGPVGVRERPGFGWRALVIMGVTPLSERLDQELRLIGFQVTIRQEVVDPLDIPVSERPDLVVVSTDAGVDPIMLTRYWTAPTTERPRAVVLVDPLRSLDRLRTAAAGVDASFGPESLPQDLVEYARALAQVGAPPARVMVVEDDPAQAKLLASWLGRVNATVTICGSAGQAREVLATMTPDLVLLDVDLPDVDGYAIARLIRQEARLALTPVVFLTAHHSLSNQLEGLRAGGDDFLQKPVERNHLLQLTLTRIERGRRIRELVHRDGLTGALNHAALMGELEHSIAYASRHQQSLCFLMLDLDHFKRVNDSWGHQVGDQVLVNISNCFRKAVRQSDTLGRYGGEEFAIILPDCPLEQGRALAERIRSALADSPIQLGESQTIRPQVSIGVAAFPESGSNAIQLTAAADRALYQAKSQGRNQVVIAGGA